MRSSIIPALVSAGLFLSLLLTAASAEVPRLVNVQGILTNQTGNAVPDGSYSTVFAIYGSSSGGSALWSETRDVTTADGLFTILLGEVVPIPASVFTSSNLWLGITVGTDSEMTPRTRLTSVGYTYRALVADSAVTAGSGGSSGGGWVDDGNVVRLDALGDSVGIGTDTPEARLDVQGNLSVGRNGYGQDVDFHSSRSASGFHWNQMQAALRFGRESEGFPWDDNSFVGYGSFAAGINLIAKRDASIALGRDGQSLGEAAVAIGDSARANKKGSIAIGHTARTENIADYSVAIGHDAITFYSDSYAFGHNVWANNVGSFVIGSGPDELSLLTNSTPHSLIIGFQSQIPIFFANGSSVGIGTISPGDRLHVNNSGSAGTSFLRLETSHASNWGECGLRVGTPENLWHLRMDDDSHNNLPVIGSLALRSQNSGKEVMTWTDAGYVGINRTDPSEALHVVGNICYTGSIGACSDGRYKENIVTLSDALGKLSQIRGVEFDWRCDEFPENLFDSKRQIGFIAQELLDVLPEVVSQGRDGYLNVDYAKLTPLLVEAIKELQIHNEALSAHNKELERRLERIEMKLGDR